MTDAENKSESSLPVTSSAPFELQPAQESLFRETLSILESEQLPYAVAGAFALRQHTRISRPAKDLDLFLTPQTASRALSLLSGTGFQCEVCDPVWLAKAHRDGYFVDLITGMSNGIIRVDDSWIERSHSAVVLRTNVRVLAPEELIASKLFVTRRERFDGSDIAHIVYATKGKLDWRRLLKLAGAHWELVLWNLVLFRYAYPAHSNYVPHGLWDDLLTRFATAVRADDPKSSFRGSLIDHKMFAIDVNEWGLENLLEQYQQKATKIHLESGSR